MSTVYKQVQVTEMREVAQPFFFEKFLQNKYDNDNSYVSEQDTWRVTEFRGSIVIPNVRVWSSSETYGGIDLDIKVNRPPSRSFFLNVNDIDSGAIEVLYFYVKKPKITKWMPGRYGGNDVYDEETARKALAHSEVKYGDDYMEVTKNGLGLHTYSIPRNMQQSEPHPNITPGEYWRNAFIRNFRPIVIVQINDHGSKTSVAGFRYIDSDASSFVNEIERTFVSSRYTDGEMKSVLFLLLSCPLLRTFQTKIRKQLDHSLSNAQTIYESMQKNAIGLVLDHDANIMFICTGNRIFKLTESVHLENVVVYRIPDYEEVESIDEKTFCKLNTFLTTDGEIKRKLDPFQRDIEYWIQKLPSDMTTRLIELHTAIASIEFHPESEKAREVIARLENNAQTLDSYPRGYGDESVRHEHDAHEHDAAPQSGYRAASSEPRDSIAASNMLYLHTPDRHWGNEMINALQTMDKALMSSLALEFVTRVTDAHAICKTPHYQVLRNIADKKYDIRETYLVYMHLRTVSR